MAELYNYTVDEYEVFEDIVQARLDRSPELRFSVIIDKMLALDKGDYAQMQDIISKRFKENSKKLLVLEYSGTNGKKPVCEYHIERPISKIISSKVFKQPGTGTEEKPAEYDQQQTLEGILEEKLSIYRKEMEHQKLQEQHNELEKKYKTIRARYKSKVNEYDKTIELYEKELEQIKAQMSELQKQASIGNQVFEGIKTAVPVLIQQKPVQNFLNGLAASQGITEPNNETVTKQPIPTEEEDEFSEEDWEHMNLILDVKEEVKDQFQVVTIILEMFMKDPSKVNEVITFLTFDKKPQS